MILDATLFLSPALREGMADGADLLHSAAEWCRERARLVRYTAEAAKSASCAAICLDIAVSQHDRLADSIEEGAGQWPSAGPERTTLDTCRASSPAPIPGR